MPRHFEKRVLPYSCEQVYALVADVERYPEFLPWCLEATVIRNQQDDMRAVLAVGYKSFRETFTSLVHLAPPYAITVEYGGGPLKRLTTQWDFKPLGETECEISFFLAFEFKSFLFGAMMDLFFDKAFLSMVSAFEERARDLYGENPCKS